jgi:hypothetical protein
MDKTEQKGFIRLDAIKEEAGANMKQMCILVDDKVGILADISYILGKSKINIEAISIGVVGGKALVCVTLKDEQRAKKLLEASNYNVLEADVLVVRMADAPGELAKMSKILSDAGISILSAHIMEKGSGHALLAVRVDNTSKARKLLGSYLQAE